MVPIPKILQALIPPAFRPWCWKLFLFGFKRFCPVCGSHLRRFLAGRGGRPDAFCPVCKSLERHRLMWLYLQQETRIFAEDPKSLLHIAPEKGFAQRLAEIPNIHYVSVDIEGERAMHCMDITEMGFPDNRFDFIYCSHVLEHVPDDRKAMRELVRILKPGGEAIVQVPILCDVTFEDPSVATPEDRERIYGHCEHVRSYGKDFKERLEAAGFRVTPVPFWQSFTPEQMELMRLEKGQDIFRCTKP